MKCILCKKPLLLFLEKNTYRIYRCPVCGLGETDLKRNYLTFVKEFYSREYYEGDPTRSAYADYELDKPLIARNMRKFLSFIRQHKPSGKLLDVGCAYGYFVELSAKSWYDSYGFDPSEFASGRAKELVGASRIQKGTIGEVSYGKNQFDIISLFDVFEHLNDPLSDMKKLASLLKPGGYVIISTGDTDSLASRIMKRRWTFYIPPQHIFFFNKKNVSVLLSRAGLRPVAWYRVGKWLSLGYVLHLARTTGESRLAGFLYDLFGTYRIMRLPLYVPMKDNMVILAQKA